MQSMAVGGGRWLGGDKVWGWPYLNVTPLWPKTLVPEKVTCNLRGPYGPVTMTLILVRVAQLAKRVVAFVQKTTPVIDCSAGPPGRRTPCMLYHDNAK